MCIRDRDNGASGSFGAAACFVAQVANVAVFREGSLDWRQGCLLYPSDAADERSSVDLGGRRILKKKQVSLTTCLVRQCSIDV